MSRPSRHSKCLRKTKRTTRTSTWPTNSYLLWQTWFSASTRMPSIFGRTMNLPNCNVSPHLIPQKGHFTEKVPAFLHCTSAISWTCPNMSKVAFQSLCQWFSIQALANVSTSAHTESPALTRSWIHSVQIFSRRYKSLYGTQWLRRHVRNNWR